MPVQVRVGLILTIVGYVGLIVSMWLKLEGAIAAAAPLMSAGGVLLGKEWFPQSDHAQQVYSKRPPPPPPVTFTGIVLLLGVVPVALYLSSCAELKPIARTVVDIARTLCLLTAEEQDAAARDGLTPAQFCEAEEHLRPFVDEILSAQKRASGVVGLTSGGESP